MPVGAAFAACALAAALSLGTGAAAHASGATLYKWVDEKGVTHYSDRPRPGAERVDIPAAQTFRAPPPPVRSVEPPRPPAEAGPAYRRVEIVQPAQDEVFINTGGQISVSAALEPGLMSEHEIWFQLDGQRIEGVSPRSTGIVVQVPRGSHVVSATVVDRSGRTLASSPPVTFHVREPQVPNPPRGPVLEQRQPTIRPVPPTPRP